MRETVCKIIAATNTGPIERVERLITRYANQSDLAEGAIPLIPTPGATSSFLLAGLKTRHVERRPAEVTPGKIQLYEPRRSPR